jgi:outer membrane lipoprotein-sorting protein
MLDKIDNQTNFTGQDISMTMTIVTDAPGKDRDVQKARFFRRDKDDKFLLLIEQPDVNKGQGYLKVDDNMWFYDPNTRDFSHTSIKEKMGSSQANNEDFTNSSLAKDYKVSLSEEGKLGKFEVWILTLEATNNKVTYPTEKLWVTKDQLLVLKSEDYSLSKKLMRTSLYTNYLSINQRFIPQVMIFVDNLNPGNKSQLTMSDVNLGAIPDSVFTKAYVERVSK